MLKLTRRPGESLILEDDIRVTILGQNGSHIRIGIDAPEDVHIVRDELLEDEHPLSRASRNSRKKRSSA